MEDSGRLSRHFWLTQAMARSIGVNVNAAVRAGRLSRADYAQAIAECCACDRCAQCLRWMAGQGAGATAVPVYCAVKPTLERLRDPG